MNVDQRWPRPRANPDGLYLATVRGETRYPSLANSPQIMFSPQVALSRHMRRMSLRRSMSTGGRPRRRRDCHRQSSRQPARCHRMRVSGLTTRTAARRSRKSPREGREQPTIEGPKARTLDLPSQHDDLLAQEQVLGDERGAGGQDREHEVSQKLQEGGHGSSGLTMGRAREVAYGDQPHFPPDGFIAALSVLASNVSTKIGVGRRFCRRCRRSSVDSRNSGNFARGRRDRVQCEGRRKPRRSCCRRSDPGGDVEVRGLAVTDSAARQQDSDSGRRAPWPELPCWTPVFRSRTRHASPPFSAGRLYCGGLLKRPDRSAHAVTRRLPAP